MVNDIERFMKDEKRKILKKEYEDLEEFNKDVEVFEKEYSKLDYLNMEKEKTELEEQINNVLINNFIEIDNQKRKYSCQIINQNLKEKKLKSTEQIIDYLCNYPRDCSQYNIFWIYGNNKENKEKFVNTLKDRLKDNFCEFSNCLINERGSGDENSLFVPSILEPLTNKRVLLFKEMKYFKKMMWNILKIMTDGKEYMQTVRGDEIICDNLNYKCSVIIESIKDPSEVIPMGMMKKIQIINMD